MNKQELINELTAYVKRYENMSDEDYYRGVYGAYIVALGLAERLDEPQKVKVPAYVAEWYEHHKHKTLEAKFLHIENAADDRVVNWYEKCKGRHNNPRGNSQEILAMMDLFGYEIEKEPRWIVKTSEEVWVNDITTNLYNSKVIDFCDDKRPALVFLDKKIAEAVALLVDGSVEEV